MSRYAKSVGRVSTCKDAAWRKEDLCQHLNKYTAIDLRRMARILNDETRGRLPPMRTGKNRKHRQKSDLCRVIMERLYLITATAKQACAMRGRTRDVSTSPIVPVSEIGDEMLDDPAMDLMCNKTLYDEDDAADLMCPENASFIGAMETEEEEEMRRWRERVLQRIGHMSFTQLFEEVESGTGLKHDDEDATEDTSTEPYDEWLQMMHDDFLYLMRLYNIVDWSNSEMLQAKVIGPMQDVYNELRTRPVNRKSVNAEDHDALLAEIISFLNSAR